MDESGLSEEDVMEPTMLSLVNMYYEDNIELKDWYISEASGTILHYNIPDEYIQEDENGQYILFESADQKYYLDGTVEGDDRLWTDDPYFYSYYEY